MQWYLLVGLLGYVESTNLTYGVGYWCLVTCLSFPNVVIGNRETLVVGNVGSPITAFGDDSNSIVVFWDGSKRVGFICMVLYLFKRNSSFSL